MERKVSKEIIIYLVAIIFILAIRVCLFDYMSGDYYSFLKPWVEQMKELGGISSLKENIGNYNVPYILILMIISFFNVEPLIPIKIVSVLFDLVCVYASYKIIYKITSNKSKAMLGSLYVSILPTVILNSAMWGQCDSIYASFCLLAIYYLLDKKYISSFVLLGVAFAFKLQAVFILPLYVLMLFRDKNIKWYYFLIIPLVNFIMCLPAVICGRNILDVLTIYFNQTNYYTDLTANFPNIYAIIQEINIFASSNDVITLIGIAVTLLIFMYIWLVVVIKKVDFNFEKIILTGMLSVVIATFFLPRMHDRYMYLADILSVIWFICYKKKKYIPITINLISLYTYLIFLLYGSVQNVYINTLISVIYTIFVIAFIVYLIKSLKEKEVSAYEKNISSSTDV